MKIVAALAVIFAAVAVISGELEHPHVRYNDCIEESGVTIDTLNTFFHGDHKYDAADTTFPSFVKCIYLKYGVLNENGEYNSENFINNVINTNSLTDAATKAKYAERAVTCGPGTEETLEGKAFNIAKCLVQATAN